MFNVQINDISNVQTLKLRLGSQHLVYSQYGDGVESNQWLFSYRSVGESLNLVVAKKEDEKTNN